MKFLTVVVMNIHPSKILISVVFLLLSTVSVPACSQQHGVVNLSSKLYAAEASIHKAASWSVYRLKGGTQTYISSHPHGKAQFHDHPIARVVGQ